MRMNRYWVCATLSIALHSVWLFASPTITPVIPNMAISDNTSSQIRVQLVSAPKPVPKPAPKPAPKTAPKLVETVKSSVQPNPKMPIVDTREPNASTQPVLVNTPTFKTKPHPITYPRSARRRHLEGNILVEVWIDKTGKQIQRNIIKSSNHASLDKAALKAIARWQFSAQRINGKTTTHRVHIPVTFKLD